MNKQAGKTGDNWHQKFLADLFEDISRLKDRDEIQDFFEDLCTPSELRSMADRWRVAQELENGKPYRAINDETGVSTATITRVARSLTYGAKGYRTLLERKKG